MLRINRLAIEIKTDKGIYGFDQEFKGGLNFIASKDNTCGKSSILAAIYYCLGFEEIIGGRGEKVLTSVYKTFIEDKDIVLTVLESGAFLEISNGEEVITIFRSVKMENRDSKLISVYFAPIGSIGKPGILCEDLYVHMPNSSTNDKGFHNYLEKFLHLELPEVPAVDDAFRKLYLQLVFSCMFIEQKRGWADIFSGMPILGIREAKKRVLEFVLRLDTLENEKKREQLRRLEYKIKADWSQIIRDIEKNANREGHTIIGLPIAPKILTKSELLKIAIVHNDNSIDEYIMALQTEYNSLRTMKPKVIDNFDQFQEELAETEKAIDYFEVECNKYNERLLTEDGSIKILTNNLEIINADIRNNKDAARLRNLGAELNCSSALNLCPTCNQEIQDNLLPNQGDMKIMSIDENVRHLVAQKEMLEFAVNGHKQNKDKLKISVQELENKVYALRRLAKSLRNDLFSTDDSFSESIVYKRLEIESEINRLDGLKEYVMEQQREFVRLSKQWEEYLSEKAALPQGKFTEMDKEKIELLQTKFVNNLKEYGYKSILNLSGVEISKDSYLPVIEGFDMKFDSSASDNIRAIWAFTLALLQTSAEKMGNHPGVILFDEPAQHSIIPNDMKKFFNSIIEMRGLCQVIIGMTIKDRDIRQVVNSLQADKYNIITIPNKAFGKISNSYIQN